MLLTSELIFQVTSLNLSGNFLTTIPDEIIKCKELEALYLSKNQLLELNLPAFMQLSKLILLDVSHNGVSRWKLKELQQFFNETNLRHLNLGYNLLPFIFGEVENLRLSSKTLQELYLPHTGIAKVWNKFAISGMTELNLLDLTGNSITWFNQIVSVSLQVNIA